MFVQKVAGQTPSLSVLQYNNTEIKMELTASASKQSWGSINSVNSLMRWGQG